MLTLLFLLHKNIVLPEGIGSKNLFQWTVAINGDSDGGYREYASKFKKKVYIIY